MKYLKSKSLQKTIRKSWEESKKQNIMPDIDKPLIKVRKGKLKHSLKKNQKLIDVFKSSVQNLLKTIKNEYLFVLTDPGLMVLAYTKSDSTILETLELGMSFSEKSVGTNAISLAKNINKAVYIKPEDHYLFFLKEWYCFALPLQVDEKIIGYLDISTVNKELKSEIIQIVDFLVKDIIKDYRRRCLKDDIKLSKKQRQVLNYIVKGYTEQATAIEMGISRNGVKYHKKKLYKKLEANCLAEAVIKASEYNLLELEDKNIE
ncbi:MAG: LuxR C-terminal-related transcriptional regulator [Halanaerobiales bacterium]